VDSDWPPEQCDGALKPRSPAPPTPPPPPTAAGTFASLIATPASGDNAGCGCNPRAVYGTASCVFLQCLT